MEAYDKVNFLDTVKTYKFQLIITALLLAGLYYPVIPSMIMDWYEDPNYSHGFIVPIIAGYFLYQRMSDLKKALVIPSNKGLLIIVAGLLLLTIAYVGTEYFTMRASLIVLLAGMVLYFSGKEVFKVVALPLGYLFFMVPLPYIIYDSIAFPLKLFVAKYSVLFLRGIGISVWREGNIIMLSNTILEVADACSGIRSLMSLLALSVAFAFLSQNTTLKRVIVIFSAIPIAIFANSLRVIVTGILAQYWGSRAAEGFFHEFAGLAVFGVAVAMLILTGAIVKRIGK
ncbi:MAG: exosortase/archaeosortase family protein [Nitrospira sp.]|nr:exosortase/archaeosortase family protein [Nitrospira sp.]